MAGDAHSLAHNRSMPGAAVIPVIGYLDVEAAGLWLCETFGFTMRLRIGAHRVQLTWRDAAIVLSRMATAGGAFSLMLRVPDVDAHRQRAAHADIVGEPADHPYGERQYTVRDPWGINWTFSQTIADVAPESWGGEVPAAARA